VYKRYGDIGTGNKSYGRRNYRRNKIQKRKKNGLMKNVQHILEGRIKLDRRCYKKRQDLLMRSIKNGEGRQTICKRKKRENMKKQLEEINQLNQQNERRKFYRSVTNMKRGFQPRTHGCKGKAGTMIGEEGKIPERWIEYFTEMLNEEEEDKED